MASQKEIENIYDVFSELLRLSLGEHFDYTCAFYNGNYSQTLQQAQKAKHEYILKGIKFRKGTRVLDIGCGWGPMLKTVQERGADAVGVTLSPDQVKVCQRDGLRAYLKDWKKMKPDEFGKFDGIVSVGAFEHFCSPKEYLERKQDTIYRQFFKLCHDILPKGGRLYLQTSVWGGNVPRYEDVSLKAPKNSNEYLLALAEKFFPGSWIPFGKEQLIKNAIGFKTVSVNTSTSDYLHTIKEWSRYGRKMNLAKIMAIIKLIPRYIVDTNFRYQIEYARRDVFTTMYKRRVMYLARLVFEKV